MFIAEKREPTVMNKMDHLVCCVPFHGLCTLLGLHVHKSTVFLLDCGLQAPFAVLLLLCPLIHAPPPYTGTFRHPVKSPKRAF